MNCPCCGEQTDRPFIIIHNTMHLPDGTKLYAPRRTMVLLTRLFAGPVKSPDIGYRSFITTIWTARKFLKDYSLPYEITYDRAFYRIKERVS